MWNRQIIELIFIRRAVNKLNFVFTAIRYRWWICGYKKRSSDLPLALGRRIIKQKLKKFLRRICKVLSDEISRRGSEMGQVVSNYTSEKKREGKKEKEKENFSSYKLILNFN